LNIDPRELEQRFGDLVDLEMSARIEALQAIGRNAPDLARRLAMLLDAHDADGDPVGDMHDQALRHLSTFDPESLVGRQLDGWTLLRLIGRGGMGVVYEARRERDGVAQEAAIKLLPAPLFDASAAQRFVHEARSLARLDHPGICRLRDWGHSAEGWPFLVLDLVHGEALPANGGSGPLREKLEVMARIADAVAAAHRQFVAHLDLKPANVRMAGEGMPVLLDFGVSRLLDDVDSGKGGATTRWLTPRYASPEQLRGEPPTAAADIHALGVMLYEQATGSAPFELEGISIADALQRIDRGAVPPRRLRPGLPRDLDAICARAMHPDPTRRYASAAELAADLRALIDKRPISARPDSLGYRISRLIARHPVAVPATAFGVAAVSVLAVLLALQAHDLARQRDRAELAARQANAATSLLLDSIKAADPTGEYGAQLKFSELIERAEVRVDTELAGIPQLQASVLSTLADVRRALGQNDLAIPLYQRARDMLANSALEGDDAIDLDHRVVAGLADALRGDDRTDEAIRIAEAAISASGQAPSPGLLLTLARARIAQSQDDDAEAAVQRALLGMTATDGEARAEAFGLLADIESMRNRYREAVDWQQRALDQLGQGNGTRAHRARILSAMAFNHSRLGAFDLALGESASALDLHLALYGEQHPATVRALLDQGYVMDDAGQWREALVVAERAMHIERKLSEGQSRRMERLLTFASTLHRRLQDSRTALGLLLQARDLATQLYPPGHRLLGNIHSNLGALHADLGNIAASIAEQRKAHEVYDTKAGDEPSRGRFIAAANLASALCDNDEAAEGVEWAARAEQEAASMLQADSWLLGNVRMIQARCMFRNGDPVGAEARALLVEQAYARSETPVQPSALISNAKLLMELNRALGRPTRAHEYAQRIAALEASAPD